VDEFVVDDQVLRTEQVADRRDVGRMAADEDDGIVGAVGPAIAASSSRCTGRSPDTGRLADTEVP
jgi:hypothetical protein